MPDPPDPTPDAELVAMFTEVLADHAKCCRTVQDGKIGHWSCGAPNTGQSLLIHQAERLALGLEQRGWTWRYVVQSWEQWQFAPLDPPPDQKGADGMTFKPVFAIREGRDR